MFPAFPYYCQSGNSEMASCVFIYLSFSYFFIFLSQCLSYLTISYQQHPPLPKRYNLSKQLKHQTLDIITSIVLA